MPVPSLSFLVGVVVLGYLCTFVVFAILRIVTGVSIQRVGYTGFRRIAFSPRQGLTINIRGVGISIHRPTFALPTWCSLVITELVLTVDLKALDEGSRRKTSKSDEKTSGDGSNGGASGSQTPADSGDDEMHGKLWRRLTEVKEMVKRLHRQVNWIRLVDLIATAITLDVVGVGTARLERLTLSMDTRKQTVDRSRLFQHHKHQPETQAPAEWKALIRSILFTPEGRDSTEVLDYGTLNIHGMLHRERDGLRDASISLKLGRLNVPYDDLEYAKRCADLLRGRYAYPRPDRAAAGVSTTDEVAVLQGIEERDESIVQAVSDSKAFIASILRGIQEVQFAVGFVGLSKKLAIKASGNKEVYFNFAMKELGLDVLRLDSKSPAHRMYFSSKDVAHQALVTGIAISAGVDDGQEHPERMLYIPMITATVKTTLPSRTIHYSEADDVTDRNTNILYANFVCTSPSIDLDQKHLPLVQELLKQRSRRAPKATSDHHNLISQLLPKAHVKLSIQEPVIRISLPALSPNAARDDFDLLISSVSSVALECESSHTTDGQIHYSLNSYYRHSRHRFYYQTAVGDRHDLLQSEFVEVQVDVNAIPDVAVVAKGKAQTFTIFLIRPDICEGVRQVLKQLRRNVLAPHDRDRKPRASFLRTIPSWITDLHFEGSDFGLQLAGVDEQVSKDCRGFALQLESWTLDYKAQRDDEHDTDAAVRRKSLSAPSPDRRHRRHKSTESTSSRKRHYTIADGRRLTFHIQNLEGLILDSLDESEQEHFMSLPQFEVAFTTQSDSYGPIFHVNSFAKSLLLHYSLYNHFAISVAAVVIRKTFLEHDKDERPPPLRRHSSTGMSDPIFDDIAIREITSIDFKANLIQVKARMPSDPPMMLQIYHVEAGRHRWSSPFLRSGLTRMYVRAPVTKSAWSRLVSVKALRLDLRDLRRKTGKHQSIEKSIDIAAQALRITVPHSLIVHTIFDNITNVIKTTKQLAHHFTTGTNDYILTKEPEGPKHVPRITLRSQVLLFDVEDSHFEWKLGAIYRAGLSEQKQRLAREQAFKLKEKRLARSAQRGISRVRGQSAPNDARSRSRNRQDGTSTDRRSRSAHRHEKVQPGNIRHNARHTMRYDASARCKMSDATSLSIEQAREKLHRLNAQSWKMRIDKVKNLQGKAIRDLRKLFGVSDDIEDVEQHEPIIARSNRPSLMAFVITDLNIVVDKPSFPIDEYPRFMHDVGKGMPKDMKYGLLLPMNLHITMSEARVQLRDYPLPLLHVPALASAQSARLPALSMRTDFVVAEEFRDLESQRCVSVQVVPPEKMKYDSGGFNIDVRRTISAVKTYSDMKFEINTSNATKIAWSTSYQPAIQDTMQIVESFTKPPVDLSDRVGFWDKIRLSFHSRINVSWKGDGDVHLVLKGSRDPYVVTGQGAGLVMVWRRDVKMDVAQHDDPRRFLTVNSGEYMLAIPDFNGYARSTHDMENGDDASTIGSTVKRDALFRKVIMKLSGKVTWLAGLMFERDIEDGKRTFDFKPHYDVVLKHPDFSTVPDGLEYDAYRGFRSHHIHLSIAISAPHDRDWSVNNIKPSDNYNSVHLTPRFFSHFFSWWSMFSGVMSLPIRQGPLWGAMEKKSKKFGRHMATIKYNLLLSPLYISHVYKHKEAEDYNSNSVSVTGLKMRLDSFMLDLHQRREHFDLKGREGERAKTTSGMKINQAQLDFISADLRALSANIEGTSAEDLEDLSNDADRSVDLSKFYVPDKDTNWIDLDDFVELDWILPAEADPATKILPLGYAPRFTYFRQTDHHGTIAGDASRTSPFGDEPTHYCVMSGKNDPRRVQSELIDRRLTIIKEKQAQNMTAVKDQEVKIVKATSEDRPALEAKLVNLRSHIEHLQGKHEFLRSMLNELLQRLEEDDPSAVPDLETSEEFYEAHESAKRPEGEAAPMDTAPLADYTSDFNNRFIVHNAQIKWNNSLRNIILRYIHQNSQRRGFVYYMSRRAVKFILDVLEERHDENEGDAPRRTKSRSTQFSATSPDADDEATVQDRIEELLRDGRNYVSVDEPSNETWETGKADDGPNDDISIDFTPLNTYHFRLIAPQIQLQSEKNPSSAVLVTAKGMQLKVVQIMEKDKIDDDVSGLVQRRFNAAADSVQMFVTSSKTFSNEYLHFYSSNRYGAKAGTYWPPWVPMEIMFQFHSNPYGFHRIVHRTSASLRYDKYNTLRLKQHEGVSSNDHTETESAEEAENRMDHVWLEFPRFRAICDSRQYFALYIIAMDLLLYNEPLEKTRSERLEKIMLASDFSDLTGAPETVQMLQERIRQLEEIKLHFQVNERYLDRQGWKDRIVLEQDLASCEDELFFMMKAITTSQQHIEDRGEQNATGGYMHMHISAKEIAWHLIRDKGESQGESLMEVQLKDASFDRTENYDGSNYNSMELGRINGYNLLGDALYPEIIAPFTDASRGGRPLGSTKMLRVHWLMLEAIAGIPVVDYFEVDLVPLKLQLEREVAKKLFEYIFPGAGGNAFDGGGFSPFMVKNMLPTQEEEDETTDAADSRSALGAETTDIAAEQSASNGSGPGALEQRLKPTLGLANQKKAARQDQKGLGISNAHSFAIFQHGNKSRTSLSSMRVPPSRQPITPLARSPSERSLARSSLDGDDKPKRAMALSNRGHNNDDKKKKSDKSDASRDQKAKDDLTQMMNRASNYMTLAYVKIPSMVLCLSYQGQGKRNLEDVHDLVFTMPTLEYRNKTWSNLDLALQLKKDVIRALITHAGAILGNKFSHYKPNRLQQSRLRELVSKSTFMSPSSSSTGLVDDDSETNSLMETVSLGDSLLSSSAGRPSRDGRPHSSRKIPSGPESMHHARRFSEDGGVANGHPTPRQQDTTHSRLSPAAAEGSESSSASRNRTSSISRHLSGFGDRVRIRQKSGAASSSSQHATEPVTEDPEEVSRKSKLLLGGQKLLGRLRD